MSQVEKITEILERDGQISNFWCIHNHLTLRLAARIADLRQAGWIIRTEQTEDKNTIYHLVSKPALKQANLLI